MLKEINKWTSQPKRTCNTILTFGIVFLYKKNGEVNDKKNKSNITKLQGNEAQKPSELDYIWNFVKEQWDNAQRTV